MLTRYAPLGVVARDLASDRLALAPYWGALLERLDAIEPELQAFLPEPGRQERVSAQVADLAARWPDPAWRPPLYGVPLAVDDRFGVTGFTLGAGAALPEGMLARSEALLVTLLKEAGAIVLGTTHTAEFGAAEPGPTRNPHRLTHTPGGGASGSAAAVAAGLAPLALAGQTTHPLAGPAAYNGVASFIPSQGRSPTDGLLTLSPSLDAAGLFSQDLAGLALAAAAICRNWQPVQSPLKPVLGVPEGLIMHSVTGAAREAFEQQLERLAARGIAIKRVPLWDDTRVQELSQAAETLAAGELARTQASWFQAYERLYRPRTAALVRRGQAASDSDLARARALQAAFRLDIQALMTRRGITCWATPSACGSAPEGLDDTGPGALSLLWTFGGLPSVSLPAGTDTNGMPLGLALVAPHGADESLLAWAETLELLLASASGAAATRR